MLKISTDTRIIFITQMVAYGGIERNVIGLAEYLKSRDIPYVVLCFYSDIDLAHYAGWPINVQQLTRSGNQYVKAWALRQALRNSRFMPLVFGIKGAFNLGIFRCRPSILHFTDPPSLLVGPPVAKFDLLKKLRHAIAHFYTAIGTRRAQKMVTMTEKNRLELLEVYGKDALVLPQGGRPAKAPAVYRKPDGVITLLSVCRLETSKRIDWIIRAAASLRDDGNAIRLIIVGKGPQLAHLQRLVAELEMQEQVVFCGEVSDAELEKRFSNADIFVMPAVQGYGLPALEALYRRIPVLLHKDSGVSEVLTGHPWAEVFSGGIPEMTQALNKLIGRLKTTDLNEEELASLPTERGWAEKLSKICGWV